MRSLLASTVVVCLAATALVMAPGAEAQRRIPINIESEPSGATVHLDSAEGQVLGTTPIRNVRVPVGSHTLYFKKDNHETARLPVNVRRWRETFRAVLNPLSTLVISAGNAAANSAAVRIDGEPLGNVPFRGTVQPGRHLVQVGKEGHVTFSQWVELSGGQVMTLPVLLEAEAPDTGSLLVAGDVSGAPVYVDGEPRGVTPTVVENIPAGEHQIEIRPEGMDVHRETVRVRAGERTNVTPTLRAAPAQSGSLRVITNVPATIKLDGDVIGPSPATAEDVAPGQHILEAEAEGYESVQQPVTIESGERQVVNLALSQGAAGTGRILVDSNVGSAIVTIDGEARGNPPVVIQDAPAGTHTVIVEADGYADFRTTCTTGPNRDCEISARLQGEGTPVRVTTSENIRGAQLYIDGELMGPIPYEGNIPAGEHRMEIKAPGYDTHLQQINLQLSSTARDFDVVMVEEGDMTEEERAERAEALMRARTGAASHSAAPLVPDLAVFDISVGWPHLAELRLNVGILEWIEGGFAMRTFFRYFEFEGRAKVGSRPVEQISVGAQVRVGGGIGPARDPVTEPENVETSPVGESMSADSHAVNSVFLSLEGMASLHFSDAGAFTLWMGVDMYSDQYDWWGENSDCLLVSDDSMAGVPLEAESGACNWLDDEGRYEPVPAADSDEDLRDGRQSQARVRLGGALELTINRHWNIWGLLEGIIAGPPRDLYGDILGAGEDLELYMRLGLTHKF